MSKQTQSGSAPDLRPLGAPRLALLGAAGTARDRTSPRADSVLVASPAPALDTQSGRSRQRRGAPPGRCSPSARGRSGAFCTAPGTPARGDRCGIVEPVVSSLKPVASVQVATSPRVPLIKKQARLIMVCMQRSCLLRRALPCSTFAPGSGSTLPQHIRGGRAFMYRPACRIIHTGGRSTGSPRSARSSSGSAAPAWPFAPPSAPPAGCKAYEARTAPPSAPQRRRLHPLEQCAGSGAADCNPHDKPGVPTDPCKLQRLLAPSPKTRAAPLPPQQREGRLCSAVAAAALGGPVLWAVAPSRPAAQHTQVSKMD